MVAVAQQVEHRIVTPEVAGSRPVGHPNIHKVYKASASLHDKRQWTCALTGIPRPAGGRNVLYLPNANQPLGRLSSSDFFIDLLLLFVM